MEDKRLSSTMVGTISTSSRNTGAELTELPRSALLLQRNAARASKPGQVSMLGSIATLSMTTELKLRSEKDKRVYQNWQIAGVRWNGSTVRTICRFPKRCSSRQYNGCGKDVRQPIPLNVALDQQAHHKLTV